MNYEELKEKISNLKGQKEAIENQEKSLEDTLDLCALSIDGLLKAREFFQHQADTVQKEIVDTISNLISMALADIFPDPYSCVIETGIKRNATEANILFEKNGMKLEPKDAVGGGPIDVASFAGRVAFVHLSGDAKIIVGDEPFKFVSRDLLDRCPAMLKTLTSLGHQFILISHLSEVIEAADNVIEIEGGSVV
jgi:DNA repair exonuclease SbcCD ATPase subunit